VTSRIPDRRQPLVRPSRAERKARLLTAIEQQRIDILVEASRWREASQPIDDGWHSLMRFKAIFLGVGGVLLIQSARHPSSLIRVAKRLAAGTLMLRRARRLLGLTR
jgi:hypothetical protein